MEKYELNEELNVLYRSQKSTPFYVDVPTMRYLTFHGSGHPAQEDFQISCEALFTLSYILKFEIGRKERGIDYKVSPMEVTWYLDKKDNGIDFTWDMMIMQPEFLNSEDIDKAIKIAKAKNKVLAYDRVSYRKVEFGKCVQCFHKGDYNNMNDTLARMIAFTEQDGLNHDLYTHDVYLNDMRKTQMKNYKTIMRLRVF